MNYSLGKKMDKALGKDRCNITPEIKTDKKHEGFS